MEFPAGSQVEVRTALSYVSVDGARANLDEAARKLRGRARRRIEAVE